jgi:hypothetical protein
VPQLYLYSKGDDLCPAEDVEAHVAFLRARGCLVRGETFPHSPHVAHYLVYPQEYQHCVAQFVSSCHKRD